MPELPEVETVRKKLEGYLKGKKINDVKVLYPNIVVNDLKEFNKIIGQTINSVKRRGKWLIFDLDDYYMLSHLRMEGKYFVKDFSESITKHNHVIFNINNEFNLIYDDTRKFGRMNLINKDKLEETINIGLEPFSDKLTVNYLKDEFKNIKLPIKTTLLDQKIIAGIGNIYANEILFLSNINPLKKTNELKDKELKKIITNTRIVLDKAILNNGTTIKSYEALGNHGDFQNMLCVHGRKDEKCPNCQQPIVKIVVNGRGTYYCPKCQK